MVGFHAEHAVFEGWTASWHLHHCVEQ